jgi:hypothetical protein
VKRAPLALAAALLAALPAAASTALAQTVEDLARASDAVVRGVVERQESRRGADGWRIYTFVEIRTTSAWKGSPPERVVVRVPGGAIGSEGQRALGAAVFAEGEEVAVFLARAGQVYQVTGLSQGKFAVEGGTARNDTRELHLLGRPVPSGERLAGQMPVEELERRVRSAR